MSRDTAGQPVTASGPGTVPPRVDMPPVPGPDAPGPGKDGPTVGASLPGAESPVPGAESPVPGAESPLPGAGSPTPARGTRTAPPARTPVREPKVPHTVAAEKVPTAAPSQKKTPAGPRRVRLAVSRLDPWSVMKLSFLMSIAIGIMLVVASIVFWLVLDGLHVFTEVNDMIVDILGEETETNILQFVELKRVVSLATMIAIVDVVLLTALSTIGAFLYNVVAALVGGVHLTLTDE